MNALRIPSTSLSQSQTMQLNVEEAVAKFPQVAYVFSKTGTAEVASDPMPPNSSDTFVILKPKKEWPDPSLSKAELQEQIEKAVGKLAGNLFEFSQPIQLRFNELLAGTRGDLAVKVFGEEFEPMTKVANQIAAILRGIAGAEDVKVEQTSGLPFLEVRINKSEAARYGLSTGAIQNVIGTAIGGRDAGIVFEGDRRVPVVVRLTDKIREDREALENIPVPLAAGPNGRAASVLLKQVASFEVSEGPNQLSRENGKRRVVVTASVRGRDIGSLVAEARAKTAQQVNHQGGIPR
jgi:cobalt-zinc-cadmium resistance protein CzcA